MSGFTPGPWVVEPHRNLAEAKEAGCFEWSGSTGDPFDGGPVGCVFQQTKNGITGLPGSIETSLANARLIAAAPDLLEALTAIQEWLMDTAPMRDDGIMHPLFIKANNLAAAAISKARGDGA